MNPRLTADATKDLVGATVFATGGTMTKYWRGQAITAGLVAGLLFLAAPAEAQITFRAASSAGVAPTVIAFRAAGAAASAASGNVTPGLPAGWQPNDIHILIVEQKDNVVSTVPAGWTLLNAENSGTTHRASLWWRRAVAGDTNPLVTHAAGNSIIAQIIGFSGVDTTTAFDVANSFTVSGADLTTEAGGITTVTTNAMLVFTAHMADNHTSIGLPTPGTWTQAFFSATASGSDSSIAAHYSGLLCCPGAQAAVVATRSGALSAISHGAQLALRPAPVPLTISKPTGTAQNDVMIASIAVRPNTVTITPPAGWTLVRRMDSATGTSNSLAIYRKAAGASEPASYTWTLSTHTGAAGGIQTFTGVDTTNPINVENGWATAAATTHSTPDVTTTVANTMLVTSHAVANADTWSPPFGMTEAFDILGANEAIEGSYVLQAAAGATGPKTATDLGPDGVDGGNAHILALRPSLTCGAVSDPTYVAANAQIANGQVTVYWSSANPVVILRKSGAFAGQAPVNGTTYTAGQAVGAATVAWVGSGTSRTETPTPAGNYYYKVFAYTSGPCYSGGAVNTADGVSASTTTPARHAWSYALVGGGALAAPIAGDGTLYTPSNAGQILALNTANGTQSWLAATNAAVQSWLSWIPGAAWKYRKQITIGTVTGGPHTDFPVLISLTDPDLQSKAQASGNDIFFTAADGSTKLSHEIEKYDGTTGQLVAWVRVPSLSTGTVLYMYYGNGAASNQQDAGGVWSNGYVGIWHLKESPTGAAGEIKDSTVNAGHGTSLGGMTSADQVAGKIGGALNFVAGTTSPPGTVVDTGDRAVMQLPVYSWSMWIKGNWNATCPTPSGPTGANEQPLWNADAQFNFAWGHSTCAFMQAAAHTDGTWRSAKITSIPNLLANTWYHIAATFDGANLRIYLNGALEQTTAHGTPITSTGSFAIGNGIGFTRWAGQLDEVRVGSAVRSDAWIQTEYNNQNSPGTFYSVGAEGLTTGGSVVAGDQGTGGANSARVYSVDAMSGAKNLAASISGPKLGNGADSIQAAASTQLWAYSNSAFRTALASTYGGYSGDVIFVATINSSRTNNTVYALKATDGSVLWNFNTSLANPTCPCNVDGILGQPVVDYWRNRVYVASKAGVSNNQQNLWILDSVTGALVQSLALGTGHIQTAPSMSYDGNTLYVADVSGNLYAVNLAATPPAPKWTAPAALGSAIKDTGFVWGDYSDYDRFYFSTASGHVWCLRDPGVGGTPNVTTPCPGWSAVNTPVPGASTVLLLDKLLVSSWNGTVGQIYQLDPGTGAIEVGPSPAPKQVIVGDGTKQPGDASSEYGNEIFVGTTDGKIFKFNLTGGSL
jgi:hypothetical protein